MLVQQIRVCVGGVVGTAVGLRSHWECLHTSVEGVHTSDEYADGGGCGCCCRHCDCI